jgi:hypothetical protein
MSPPEINVTLKFSKVDTHVEEKGLKTSGMLKMGGHTANNKKLIELINRKN